MKMNAITPTRRQSGITPNGPRTREAILNVIREADSRNLDVSQFDILKTLFLADREHLNKYGRPITFDEYVAMPDGPVASLAYDILKSSPRAFQEAGMTRPLWQEAQKSGEKKKKFFNAERDASEDVLSETDIEELNAALIKVKSWGYKKTWDHVHADPAYIDAWSRRDGDALQHFMDHALMLDEVDPDQINDLKFLSAHL